MEKLVLKGLQNEKTYTIILYCVNIIFKEKLPCYENPAVGPF